MEEELKELRKWVDEHREIFKESWFHLQAASKELEEAKRKMKKAEAARKQIGWTLSRLEKQIAKESKT